MDNKQNLYQIDGQGNIKFQLRSELASRKETFDTIWENPFVSVAVMIVCCVVDFIMFKQMFSSFLYDSMWIQYISIMGMLIGFDICPIYLGIVAKKRSQGIKANLVIGVIAIAIFLLALSINFALRVAVKDLVLPDFSSSVTSVFGEVNDSSEGQGNILATVYAVFSAVLPIITSMGSFIVSFMSSNPLKKRLTMLEVQQVAIENRISEIEATLIEFETDSDYKNRLLEEDWREYQSMLFGVKEGSIYYCDYVRERIKEKLGDPVSLNALSLDNRVELTKMLDGVNSYAEKLRINEEV